ncbi:clathrin assembly protein [Anaeramoeba flamelloides]|uniref:Clathrin assembly protein n=1 Tax=Anaeramoeba flamelloides TaxID=1746091 RepID=A0ABQ8ZA61_9EUKA|nr:clathrin assembly protein [Anaeramoeba flamelloides]
MSLKKWVKNKSSVVSANSEIEIRVVKATNHDFVIPKKKHVDYLKKQTHVYGAINGQMARIIAQRLQKKSYMLVFKSLLLLHNLMNQGHKNFITTFASKQSNSSFFGLSHFKDLSTPKAFEYNEFIRQYSAYLEEKLVVFKAIRFSINHDIGESKTTKYQSSEIPKIIKELPSFQEMLNLIFKCEFGSMYNDPLFNEAYYLLNQDVKNLYKIINDASVKIIDSFFKLQKSSAESCLKIYKTYHHQSSQINKWLKSRKSKFDYPDEDEDSDEDEDEDSDEIEKGNSKKKIEKLIVKMEKYVENVGENGGISDKSNESSDRSGEESREDSEEESDSESEDIPIKKLESKEKIVVSQKPNNENSQPQKKEINLFGSDQLFETTNINTNITTNNNNPLFDPFTNNSKTNNQSNKNNDFLTNINFYNENNNTTTNNNKNNSIRSNNNNNDNNSFLTNLNFNNSNNNNNNNNNNFKNNNNNNFLTSTNFNNNNNNNFNNNNFNNIDFNNNNFNNNFNSNNTFNNNRNNNISNKFKNIVGQNFNRNNTNSQVNWNWGSSTNNNNNRNFNNVNKKTNPFGSFNNNQQTVKTNNSNYNNINNNNNQSNQMNSKQNPFLSNNQSKVNDFRNIVTKIGQKKKHNDQFSNLVAFTNF